MAITLDELIRVVQHSADDDLQQLGVAATKARELGELGDSLLNHFVDRSRRAGHTWAEIGEHLGVTRQAAQKRFVDSAGTSLERGRFTDRAKTAMHLAGTAARELQHNYVGTEHLLLGLLDGRGTDDSPLAGIAGQVLAQHGMSRDDVEAAVVEIIGRGPEAITGVPPLTPRTAKTIEEAIAVSRELAHNYQGTEHLLLGIYRVKGGVARKILEDRGISHEMVMSGVMKAIADYVKGQGAGQGS